MERNMVCPYSLIIQYGINKKILDKDFTNKNNNKYVKYLVGDYLTPLKKDNCI